MAAPNQYDNALANIDTGLQNDPYNKGSTAYNPDEANAAMIPLLGSGAASDLAAQSAANLRQAAVQNAAGMALPEFGAGYAAQGSFTPAMNANPLQAQASLAQTDPEGRAAQLAALGQIGQQSSQAVGSQQALDRYNAAMDANQTAGAQQGAIAQDAARRGQMGSAGQEVMAAQAGQQAANRQLNAGMQSAQMAALQRLAGTQAASGMAGQLRGQDQSQAYANQNAINNFNMYNTQEGNKVSQMNTGLQNQGQLYNLGLKQQDVARGDQNQQTGFNDQLAKVGAINAPLSAGSAQAAGMLTAGQNATNQGVQSGWNDLKDIAKGIGAAAGG